ncbi:MAG: YndJ family transporter, partial [Planctomycetes bacterium]|nr:YndJ family transporter [Planctomycetota bacterium]
AVCVALALVSALGIGPLGLLELLFLLAAWVIVPLGLGFIPDSAPLRLARKIQPAAAILTTVSFFLPKGIAAAALTAPWVVLNGLVALGGLLALKESFRGGIPSLLLLAAMIFPPVGGVHLVSSRLGYALSGFPEPIIILTAVHFHYTAFAAPILSALTSRTLSGPLRQLAMAGGLGLVGGTPLLAAGFLFSPRLKVVAVGILVVSILSAAAAQIAALPKLEGRGARLLLLVSSLAVMAGMALAAAFEHGVYTGRTWLSIPEMAWSHGLLNGLGFSLCGLLAYTYSHERPRNLG